MKHFLQSEAWAEFQTAYGRTVVSEEGSGWSYNAMLEKGKLATRLYAPYGPFLEKKDTLTEVTESLLRQATRHNAAFIRIEPTGEVDTDELIRLGFRKVTHVQPENTSVVDLTGSIDDIIAAMAPNNRNLYRTHTQKGLSVHKSKDSRNTTVLIKLLHGVAQRTGLRNFPDSYIQKQADVLIGNGSASLFNITFENQPLVAALIYDSEDTRYYAHAAASYAHRNLNAGNVLVAEMIIDAKKKGLKHFDLYGIWPHTEKGTSQAGITRFKRSFGGEDVHYAGTWELPVKPYLYALNSVVTKLAKMVR